MKNYTLRLLCLLFLFCLFLSCNKSKVLTQSNYSDFISHLYENTPEERQKELLRISEGLSKTLSEAEDLVVYFGFSMSFSSGDETTIDWDTINWNQLDIEESFITIKSPLEIQSEFEWYIDSAYAIQKRELPDSKFNIDTESYSIIDRENVKTNILQYFSKKGITNSSKVGLETIDSLEVEFTYSHTLSLDTLIIPQGTDSVIFQGHTIYIDELKPQHIELNLPIGLYDKFVGHLGVTPNNKYISSKNNSFMPSWGLTPSITANARKALDIFDKYARKPLRDDDLKHFETELTEECYTGLHKVFEFIDAKEELLKLIDKEEDSLEQLGKIREFIEANVTLFAPVEQNMEIAYPYPVKEIIFCFTKDTMNFSAQKIIPVKCGYEVVPYDRIYDESTSMFGVIDSLGEIVIRPQYKSLYSLGNLFFYDDEAKESYRLDVKNKKMQPLKTKHRYSSNLGNELYVFYSEEGRYGILNNDFKEVIPFEYQSFDQYGELIGGHKKVGYKYVSELFTRDGKYIKLPPIESIIENEFLPGVILIDDEGNQAFMTPSGEIIVPFDQSHELSVLNSDKVFLLKKEDICYFVDKQGNEIELPEFVSQVYVLSRIHTNDIFAFVDKNNKDGFLNERGEVVSPMYEFIYGNKNDVSMVLLSDRRRVMVDDKGNILKDFGHGVDPYEVMLNDDLYYVIDEVVYDWKGNKTDMEKSDLYN